MNQVSKQSPLSNQQPTARTAFPALSRHLSTSAPQLYTTFK